MADPQRLAHFAALLLAECGESDAIEMLRRERDSLRSMCDRRAEQATSLMATINERNEEHRRLWDENERRKTENAILQIEIDRLGRALAEAEAKLDDIEQLRLERSERE